MDRPAQASRQDHESDAAEEAASLMDRATPEAVEDATEAGHAEDAEAVADVGGGIADAVAAAGDGEAREIGTEADNLTRVTTPAASDPGMSWETGLKQLDPPVEYLRQAGTGWLALHAGPFADRLLVGHLRTTAAVSVEFRMHRGDETWLKLVAGAVQVQQDMAHLPMWVLAESHGATFMRRTGGPGGPLAVPAEYPLLRAIPFPVLRLRAAFLEHVGRAYLQELVKCADLAAMDPGERATLKNIMSLEAKVQYLYAVLDRTSDAADSEHKVPLNRLYARDPVTGLAAGGGSQSVFGQVAALLKGQPDSFYRRSGRLFKVSFAGEAVDDAGGGSREALSEMFGELTDGALDLFQISPNGRHDKGDYRDCYVFNPAATEQRHLELLVFLGKLLGAQIRQGNHVTLPLALPVWHMLAGSPMTMRDLRDTDLQFVENMQLVRDLPPQEANFSEARIPTHSVGSDGRQTQPLVPGRILTPDTRAEYIRRAVDYRLHEADEQVAAVRQGLACSVPLSILSLLTGEQLQQIVTGPAVITAAALREIVVYSGVDEKSDLVRWFWKLFEDWSAEQRERFLRFCWGRTKLPARRQDYPSNCRNFQFQVQATDNADGRLPTATTCFFLLHVPAYSCEAVLREKLNYAVQYCKAIDQDNYARMDLAEVEEEEGEGEAGEANSSASEGSDGSGGSSASEELF